MKLSSVSISYFIGYRPDFNYVLLVIDITCRTMQSFLFPDICQPRQMISYLGNVNFVNNGRHALGNMYSKKLMYLYSFFGNLHICRWIL